MSNLFKRLACMVGRHAPARRKVHYDGHLKNGPCKHCGIELEKAADGRWLRKRK